MAQGGWPKHGEIHCLCKRSTDQHLCSITLIVEHILIIALTRFGVH